MIMPALILCIHSTLNMLSMQAAPCPKLQAYLQRCEASAAYKRAMEKGGLEYSMDL